jgi:hypothetical protein
VGPLGAQPPLPSAAAAALALAILAPAGWYLGSPLFLSTTVDEAAPVVAPAPSVPPASQAPTAASDAPATIAPTEAPALERTGTFLGADEFHFGEGTARLIETAPGRFTVRLEDFAVRNGPDLFVHLSPVPDGYGEGAIELGRLKADRGNQNYEIPAGTDLSVFGSVVIWCKQFSVLFATATLP